tara:strand:+ start:1838 stop:2647 length:810 start_codon:yes stop_codon:yes gene_type:complete
MKKYYFIGGIHRSGSTLLSAILNQNPRFHSGPMSPVLPMIEKLETFMANDEFYASAPKPQQAHKVLSSIIHNYHSDIEEEVVFDKHRMWPKYINYIEGYVKEKAKIICPVRDIDEVVVSFLKIIHKNKNTERLNPIDRDVLLNDCPLNDISRSKMILRERGYVDTCISAMKWAVDAGLSDRLLFVEYRDLVMNPEYVFKSIYNFLEEEYYDHDFKKIKNNNEVKDEEYYGLKGLHDVREKLEITSYNPKDYLTEDIINECRKLEFWRNL